MGTRWERLLVTAAIIDPWGVIPESHAVTAQQFSHPMPGRLWTCICEMYEAGIPVDVIYVAHYAEERGIPCPPPYRDHLAWIDALVYWFAVPASLEEYRWLAAKVIEASKVRSING
jgi:hypothetical protein